MSRTILHVNHLTKHFRHFAFGPIDLQIEPGEAVALIGANGSGKSTFFRLLMRLIQPNAGEVRIFGRDVQQDETAIKQNIGYAASGLYQAFAHLSIEAMASLRRYWYPNWDDKRFLELIRRYGIDLRQTYGDSSTGTQKKIDFIFAITHRPELLLLDEPTAGVDIISQNLMKEDMIRHLESGPNSIIIATHQQEEIRQLCDRICVLHDGKLLYTFEKDDVHHYWARMWVSELPDAVKTHPAVIEVTKAPHQLITNNRPEIERTLRQHGVTVTHLQRLQLHEVLACLVGADGQNLGR